MNKGTIPQIKWAQRKDKVFITIELENLKDVSIDLTPEGHIKFKGTSGKLYEFDIELYNEVIKEESKLRTDCRNIFLNLKKKEKGPYWPRLIKSAGKLPWLHVDWSLYVDEDEDNGDAEIGENFNDFSGPNDDEDSDDKEDISKTPGNEDPKHNHNSSQDKSND